MDKQVKELVIDLGSGRQLVAQLCDYPGDGLAPEIAICLHENGIVVQDICLVREHEYQTDEEFHTFPPAVDVLVWGDKDDEDYTNKFVIEELFYEEDE